MNRHPEPTSFAVGEWVREIDRGGAWGRWGRVVGRTAQRVRVQWMGTHDASGHPILTGSGSGRVLPAHPVSLFCFEPPAELVTAVQARGQREEAQT